MNYYEHHLGDYAAATAHLSWDEDMAYTRLLRAYYHHEKPIPVDQREACRLARASTPAQRRAVDTVLREFFDLRDDGWHQKRADEEISRYQDKQAKARRSAEARWNAQRSECERISEGNANASADAMRTHSEGNAPRHQTPDTKPNTPESAGRSSRVPAREPEPTLAGQACRLMREAGVQRVNPSDPKLAQLLSQGVTPQQLGDLARELRESKPDAHQPYVLAAMVGRLRDAAATPQHPPGTAQRIGKRPGSAFGDEIDRIAAAIHGRDRQQPEPFTIDVEARDVG
ncbi:MAG TPA: YdaU family protein [Zeimonas sp.]